MKKVIRRNCFETNSSSQHSILITKNDIHVKQKDIMYSREDGEFSEDKIFIWNDGSWHLDVTGGYGRYPFQLLTTVEDKFKYAMCEYLGYYHGDEDEFEEIYNEFIDLAKEIIPGFKEFYIYTHDIEIYHDKDGNELKYSQLEYDEWDS